MTTFRTYIITGMNELSKRYIKVFVGIPVAMLAVAIVAAIVLTVIPLFEHADKTPVEDSDKWMIRLDNEKYISDVILPGTHDSASYHASLPFFSRCQDFDIAEQLEKGFRYLDIRLDADSGEMKLVHGFASCRKGLMPWSGSLMLDDVLEQCYAFLEKYPTEFIVFAVKQDHGEETVGGFQSLMKSYIDKNPKYWLLTDNIPTVGQARGKLVLMRRYSDAKDLKTEAGISFIWKDQDNRENTSLAEESTRNGHYNLIVLDRFKYDTDDKWNAFLMGNESAEGQSGRGSLVLNFLSTNGNTAYGHPYKYAKKLNKKLLLDNSPELSGWVIVDFGTAKIARRIYNENFK